MGDFISVVIPTSRRAIEILKNAVQSVKEQSMPVYETIVVDDNSDKSLSHSISLYCQENNLIYAKSGGVGAAAARNVGINVAKGTYVAFLDYDDIWLSNKLQRQMPLFTTPDIGLVYSRGYTVKVDNNNNVLTMPYATDCYYKTEVHYNDLLGKNYIGTTSQLVIRKSILMQINGFDESLPSRQDYDLCLRIARNYRCVGADDYLFLHYIHSKNQITANAIVNMKGYQLLLKKYRTDIFQIKDAPRKWYYRIAHWALASSSYATFVKYLFLAIIDDPSKIKETIKKFVTKK